MRERASSGAGNDENNRYAPMAPDLPHLGGEALKLLSYLKTSLGTISF